MMDVLICGLLGWLSIEDIREKKVSVWPSVCLIGVGIIFAFRKSGNNTLLHGLTAVVSAAGLGAAVWLAGKISRGSIGSGDAWTMGGLGAYLGWQNALTVLFCGLLLCAVTGVLYIRIKRKNVKTEMPFIPFLTAAYIFRLITLEATAVR